MSPTRPIAIVGWRDAGTLLCLDRVLRHARRSAPLLVIDATGRGVRCLDGEIGSLLRGWNRVHWLDLADRRRPVSLYRVRPGNDGAPVLADLLQNLARELHVSVEPSTTIWAAKVSESLVGDSGNGASLSIAAVQRLIAGCGAFPLPGLPLPRTLHGHGAPASFADVGRLATALAAALSFPAVALAADLGTIVDLAEHLEPDNVVWVHSLVEHFEPLEHRLVWRLTAAAVRQAVGRMVVATDPRSCPAVRLIVAFLHPPARAEFAALSARLAAAGVQVVCVFGLAENRTLPQDVADCVAAGSDLWVVTPLLSHSAVA